MFPNSASTTLYLLTIVNKSDALGIRCPTIIYKKEAIGSMRSITSTEYQTSVTINKDIKCKVVLQAFLYDGQKYAQIKDDIYKIDRTFVNGQFIELYLELSEYKVEDLDVRTN